MCGLFSIGKLRVRIAGREVGLRVEGIGFVWDVCLGKIFVFENCYSFS